MTVEAKPLTTIVSIIVRTPHIIISLPPSLFDSSHVVSLSILHEVLTPITLLRLHFGIILPITMNINPRQQLEITFISMGILSCPSEALMSTSNITN